MKDEQDFHELKYYLSSAPLLAKPKDREPLFMYLVLSRNAKSKVLVRELNDAKHQVYDISNDFLDAETKYSHIKKLILSFVYASTKLIHYFELAIFLLKLTIQLRM